MVFGEDDLVKHKVTVSILSDDLGKATFKLLHWVSDVDEFGGSIPSPTVFIDCLLQCSRHIKKLKQAVNMVLSAAKCLD